MLFTAKTFLPALAITMLTVIVCGESEVIAQEHDSQNHQLTGDNANQHPTHEEVASQESAKAFAKETKTSGKGPSQKTGGHNATGTNSISAPAPELVTIGLYLFNIRDVSSGRGTFTSDFCIWSQSPSVGNIIGELQFANAERVVWAVEGRPEVKGLNCIKRSGTGVFRMTWNFNNYPHDSQKLRILINYTLKDSSKVILTPDRASSGISKTNLPSGWSLKGFNMEPTKLVYDSNLGDPNLGSGHGEFSGLETTIDIERKDPSEYWMMTLIAYATAFMFMISFFIDLSNTSRFGLLGAGFIACVISLRTSLAARGTFGTSIDWLHLTVMGYIILSVICTAFLSYLVHHKVDTHKIRTYSWVLGGLTSASFFLVIWLMHLGRNP